MEGITMKLSANRRPTGVAGGIFEFQAQAVVHFAPVVADIIASPIPNIRLIRQTFGILVGLASDPAGLQLLKNLCRHYFLIDPTDTAGYIKAYHDLWGTAVIDDLDGVCN